MINFTGNASHKTYEELFCLAEVTGGIHNQLISLSVLNIFLSVTAFLAPVVQKLDSAIHRISHYPVDK